MGHIMQHFLRSLGRPVMFALSASTPLLVRCDDAQQKPQFESVTCVRNEAHTHDTRKITLSRPKSWSSEVSPICNVAVRKEEASGKKIIRNYNPVSLRSGAELTLLVKKYGADAKMGGHLHALSPGDSIDVKGPNQQWKFEAGKYQHYGFVAGGTGITPIIQAARHVLQTDTARVTLITLNKTTGDILLRRDIDELQRQYPGRLDVTHVVEHGCITEGTIAVYGELDAYSPTRMLKGRATPEILS